MIFASFGVYDSLRNVQKYLISRSFLPTVVKGCLYPYIGHELDMG